MDAVRFSTLLLGVALFWILATAARRRDRLELRARIFEVVGAATRRGLALAPVLQRMGDALGPRKGASLRDLAQRLDSGESFGPAIERALPKGTLPPEVLSTILAADGTPALQELLANLASSTSYAQRAQDRIATALAYPTLLAVALLGTYVTTQSMLDELPAKVLETGPTSTLLSNLLAVVLWGGLGIAVVARFGGQGGVVYRFIHRQFRSLPAIGRLFRLEAAARVLRVAAGLSAAGLPLGEILRRAAHATRDVDVRSGILHAARCADEGMPPVEVWRHTRLPEFAVAFASLATGGGPLAVAERLRNAAFACERRMDRGVSRLLAWVQPATIALFGVLIAMHFAMVIQHMESSRLLNPGGTPW